MSHSQYFSQVPSIVGLALLVTITTGICIIAIPGFSRSYAQSVFDESQSVTPGPYSAKQIFDSRSMTTDADVTNLVVLIPEKGLINSAFLPKDATIVEGTKVIWINGEKDTTPGIEVRDEKGKSLYSNSTIQFTNATSFTFDQKGTYTYINPSSPTDTGTIKVITKGKSVDNPSTNATTPTVGLFVAPKADREFWQKHLNSLGFNVADSYTFKNKNVNTSTGSETNDGDERILYVYTQKLDKDSSVIYRMATKINIAEKELND